MSPRPTTSKQVVYKNLDGTYSHADRAYIQNLDEATPKTAFNEVLTAEHSDIVYINFPYNISSGLCTISGLHSPSYTTSSGMAVVATSASGNSKAVLSTRRSLSYVPGQATVVRLNGIFSSGQGAQKQLMGYGDHTDGLFFGVSGATFGIYVRGFGVETFIPQSGWNEAKFDGNEYELLDFTKGNAYAFQYPCYCFGEMKFYVSDPETGKNIVVHRINLANTTQTPSMDNPSLPLRIEVDNNGVAVANSMKVVSMFTSRQGHEPQSQTFGVSGAALTSSAIVHVLTISGVDTFHGTPNRKTMLLTNLSCGVNGSNEVYFEMYKNLTGLSGTTMIPVHNDESVIHYSVAGSLPVSLSGAIIGTLSPRNSVITVHLDDIRLPMFKNETYTIVARRTAGGSLPVDAFLNWREYI